MRDMMVVGGFNVQHNVYCNLYCNCFANDFGCLLSQLFRELVERGTAPIQSSEGSGGSDGG